MLTESKNFKIILLNILLCILLDSIGAASITVDYRDCEKISPTTIYPIVLNPQMRYYLFTTDNLLEGEEIQNQNDESFQNSKFNKERPTRIFIGGWKTTPQNCRTALIKDAYLKSGDFNFILVDWSDWSKREYALAAASANGVGRLLGNFTKFLNKNGIENEDMYLIGHSIGAHIAGSAGNSISPKKFKTIYGLDPAGPGFIGLLPTNRLDPNDGEYVEIITTDMLGFGYGSRTPIGHAIFYPNNGRRIQPFCPQNLTSNILDMFCSHASAVDYFANTLNPELEFCGVPTTWNNVLFMRVPKDNDICEVVMGGEPSVKKEGSFYVFVSKTGPLPA